MKLKKLFLDKAKTSLFALLILFCSCVSNSIPAPVPGQNSAKIRNIYVEYFNIADTYYNLENYSKAAEYYELSMRKRDQYWAAYYKLAKCYVFVSDWDKAISMYKTILSRDPENASLKASVAYIYSMQGKLKKARVTYEELLVLQPKNQDYLENYLAVLLSYENKFKRYESQFLEKFEVFKTEYPDNRNITIFEERYKTLMDIKEEDSEASPDPDAEEDEEIESEEEGEASEEALEATDDSAP